MSERKVLVNGVELRATVKEGNGSLPMMWAHCMGGCRKSEEIEGYFNWRTDCVEKLVKYDSRGHGESVGGGDPEDYIWATLSHDLTGVAKQLCGQNSKLIVGGASMGSATAIHAAVASPSRIRLLILCLPPPCYESRTEKRNFMSVLSESFEKPGGYDKYVTMNRAAKPLPLFAAAGRKHTWEAPAFLPESAHLAMKGASLSDYPPRDVLRELKTPTLILTWEGDSMHPEESATHLHSLIPNSTLHIARKFEEVEKWPDLVADFIRANQAVVPPPLADPSAMDASLLAHDGNNPSEAQLAAARRKCCCCIS